MPDGRSRARRRRDMIRDTLRSYIECSLRWLQTGCLRLSEALSGRSLRQLASRAANEARCTSPPDFSGDKHGRARELLANTVSCVPPSLNVGALQFSAGPGHWSYEGCVGRPAGALRIQSARVALPDPACVVSLEDRLPKSIAQSFNSPEATDQPIAPSCFKVFLHEWRAVVRRMVRRKMAVALPSDTGPVQLAGGPFSCLKRKSATTSSVIAGLKINSPESALPFCPRLRRLILERMSSRTRTLCSKPSRDTGWKVHSLRFSPESEVVFTGKHPMMLQAFQVRTGKVWRRTTSAFLRAQ